MNKTSRAVTQQEYEDIVRVLSEGFQLDNGRRIRKNDRIVCALITQINTGLRIGDVLRLRLNDIILENGSYHFDHFKEQKTGKVRVFLIPQEVYIFLQNYMIRHKIGPDELLFNIKVRTVQKYLAYACEYLGIKGVSTHGFRKRWSTQAYLNSGKDIALVSHLMQHSSVSTTMRYIGIESDAVEEVLKKSINIPAL